MGTPIRVSIVERETKYRAALTAVIGTAVDMECVGAYSDLDQALHEHTVRTSDVLLIGLRGSLDEIRRVRRLQALVPRAAVIVLGMSEAPGMVRQCLSAGAIGYLLRSSSGTQISEAIRQARRGGSPFSPRVALEIVKLFRSMIQPRTAVQFSSREREIGNLLMKGERNKDIANALNLSLPTVRSHLRTIYIKLGAGSRKEAIRKLHKPGADSAGRLMPEHPLPRTWRSNTTAAPKRAFKTAAPRPGDPALKQLDFESVFQPPERNGTL